MRKQEQRTDTKISIDRCFTFKAVKLRNKMSVIYS